MPALAFLFGAIALQIIAAVIAIRLIRVTGRQAAWILVSIALVLMALRRAIPLARAFLGGAYSSPDPLNEFIGLLLSGFMVAGIGLIRPIFERIFRSERELEESERRFRSYFELPLVGVAIVSPMRQWITVNDRLCDILGYSKDELGAASMDEIAFAEDLDRERGLGMGIFDGSIDGYSMDKRFIRKNGALAWTSQAVRCVRDSSGAPSYYVVILQDISERKVAEERLRRSVTEKDALLRELYHRTKNNMQMICSMLNLESTQVGDPKLIEEFHLISDKIVSMSLVHEMLYVSRDLTSIDLADYIRDLCALLRQSYLATASRIRLDVDIESIRVPIDTAIPLGLMLNELVTNALKHAFPGGREGSICISGARAGTGEIVLVVADDGIGLPSGFEAEESRSMGFRTVYALAEQIRGSVSIRAEGGVLCRIAFSATDRIAPSEPSDLRANSA
jgi:PAS domain S-box-containing protein